MNSVSLTITTIIASTAPSRRIQVSQRNCSTNGARVPAGAPRAAGATTTGGGSAGGATTGGASTAAAGGSMAGASASGDATTASGATSRHA